MSDGACEVSIDVPTWVPPAIAFGLSVVLAIGVCIAYISREIERHKTFYGREDKLSSREEPAEAKKKEEMEAYALGRCSHEVLVIKSPSQATPGVAAPSGVKVMLRKRRIITKTPNRPATLSIPASMEPLTPNIINISIVYDKTGRAFELCDLITKDAPVLASRSKRIDWLVQQVRTRLETMTNHHYIVYGFVEDQAWIVKGLENLRENVEETHLEMRLNVDSLNLKMMAYKIQAISAEKAMLMSMRGRTSDMRPEPTQVTPSRWMMIRDSGQATPMPHSRRRSGEIIEQDRRMNSKELLLHAAKTLRQAIHASPAPEPAHSYTSNTKAHGSTGTERNQTRRSQTSALKRSLSHRGRSSLINTNMALKNRDSKEMMYIPRARIDTPGMKSTMDIKLGEPTDQYRSAVHLINIVGKSPQTVVNTQSDPLRPDELKGFTQKTDSKLQSGLKKENNEVEEKKEG